MHWGLESFKSLFIFAALLIQNRRKPVKCRLAFRRSLINAGILQNFHEYLAEFCLYDFMDVVCRHILISGKEFLHPVRMLAKNLIAADIRAFQYCFFRPSCIPGNVREE